MPLDQLSQDVLTCKSWPCISAVQTTKKANLATGTSFSHPPGWICHHSFNGAPLTPPQTASNQMTLSAFDLSGFTPDQLQGLLSILQSHLNETPVEFSTQVQKVKEERVNKRMQELSVTVSHYETVNAAFEVALNEVLNDPKESRFIVSQLDKCRRNEDFRAMRSVYCKYSQKNLKVEEMLKTLCAVYRLKMKNYKNPSDKSSDRAIVRHEIRCPDCGEYARKLVEFLEIKGLKWADV